MISALLLDLDQTLLDHPNHTFLPAFFEALATGLSAVAAPERLVPALKAATGAMLANADPRRTLREVFDERFYLELGGTPQVVAAPLAEFYRVRFPTLARHTGPRPEARELVEWAQSAGLQVCIATNPVYPLTAIEQRLTWAGISPREFSYAVIPSYDTMHFGKPRPEYYTELLALVQKRPDEAIMVGDDWQRDIQAASAAGLHTFWIVSPGERPPAASAPPDGLGTLHDFLQWARDDECLETLGVTPPSPSSLLASLAGDLAAFHTLAYAVADWKRQPAAGEWSATEILCHLRDVEVEVNLPRLQRLASENEPFVSAADTDPWAVERDYQKQDGEAALREFGEARLVTISFLGAQAAEFWSRPARHSILGRTTPAELISFTLEHDRIHLTQIKSLHSPAPRSKRPAPEGRDA